MTNKFEAGQIIDGKVTGIQPYGAFVALDEETQGLVHISEVTHGFVKDINDHLTVGDEVKVKVLNVDEEKNKVSLSIRATEEAPAKPAQTKKAQPVKQVQQDNDNAGFNTLKDKLEEWIEQSSSFKK
ncbi:general stress protein 13 [Oceanobacillus sp. 143]|uniref:RNA-binding protein S1 n=1 Tax=Oceanobacillus zhaokaii TaxID=2052660 RepID=A0A345PIL3_9BACI|nr:S1 domain-containing post-transcriptional regulator GSP13 [Oceanobacillus zhaokaii]AXI09843.1 RNA-binding protein S1 [Oceanobacillus zhaokaii]QGS69093.1 general stress protein 13 [Oceanobacillus sp. 143]